MTLLNLFTQISSLFSAIAKNNSTSSSLFTSSLSVTNRKFTALFSSTTKPISFQDFLYHINKNTHAEKEVHLFALCLLSRLELTTAFTRITQKSLQGVYLTCFALAFKYLHDEVPTDAEFAEIGGFDVKDYGQMEIHYIKSLQFNLNIKLTEIEKMVKSLQNPLSPFSRCTKVSDIFISLSRKYNLLPSFMKKKTQTTSRKSSSSPLPHLEQLVTTPPAARGNSSVVSRRVVLFI